MKRAHWSLWMVGLMVMPCLSVAQEEPAEPTYKEAPAEVKELVEKFLGAVLTKPDGKAAAALCVTPFLSVEEQAIAEHVDQHLEAMLEGAEPTALKVKSIEVADKPLKGCWEGYPKEFAEDTVARAKLQEQPAEAGAAAEDWGEAIVLLRKVNDKDWRISGIISLPLF